MLLAINQIKVSKAQSIIYKIETKYFNVIIIKCEIICNVTSQSLGKECVHLNVNLIDSYNWEVTTIQRTTEPAYFPLLVIFKIL